MDIVYPLGTQSNWSDNELKFSLRSVEKFLSNYGKVFIVGKKPTWIKNVIHLPSEDIVDKKALSIRKKVFEVCDHADLSRVFLFMNDDYFFLKPKDIYEINNYYSGTLKQAFRENSSDNYKQIIKNTINVYGEKAPYFDIHYPVHYSKTFFKLALSVQDWTEKQYLIKTSYCVSSTRKPEERKDFKIYHPLKGREFDVLRGKDFFSIGSAAVCWQLENHMNQLFPDKSSFEV